MNRLKELRINRKLKQEDIFTFMHIAKSTYSYWENGRTEPDQASLIKLANFYNVSVDYLIGNELLGIEEMNYINSGNNNVITGNGININSSFKNSNNTNTNTNLSDEEQQLINDFRKLSKDKQAAIKLLLK